MGKRSDIFRITNGTRQGSVLSPLLFSVYLDDLIKDLRKLSLGCHIGGLWYGACGYADDLVLLAPNRDVLQRMLYVCEQYAADHNMSFSTDPVPARSKSKLLLFCGKSPRPKFPDPLQFNGEYLPWVEVVDHLGHTLHQDSTMIKGCQRARAKFIARSLEVRNQLSFDDPLIFLRALQVFCEDSYGAMLWNLSSHAAESFFMCWNTNGNGKLVFGIPRSSVTTPTHQCISLGPNSSLQAKSWPKANTIFRVVSTHHPPTTTHYRKLLKGSRHVYAVMSSSRSVTQFIRLFVCQS